MATWTTPKTDWTSTDRFNIEDYNRIKNNLSYLCEIGSKVYQYFSLHTMGDDITDYTGYWTATQFNLFEKNLEKIEAIFPNLDIGESQTFYPNGVFIDYEELNRIESAMLEYYEMATLQLSTLPRLAFKMGDRLNMYGIGGYPTEEHWNTGDNERAPSLEIVLGNENDQSGIRE